MNLPSKEEVYQKSKKVLDSSAIFMMTSPPVDKTLDILKEILHLGYVIGRAEEGELRAGQIEYMHKALTTTAEALKKSVNIPE